MVAGSRYHSDITGLTWPLMERYAQKHQMAFRRIVLNEDTLEWCRQSPAPFGTQVDYASIPYRRKQLDQFEGSVFLDADVVIVDPSEDICLTVDDNQPIGSVNGCGVVVTKSGELSKAFLDSIWAMRYKYASYQWLEQAAMLELIGYSGDYPGDNQPPRYIGPTAWSSYVREIDPKWNCGPNSDKGYVGDALFMHPFGVQPYDRRLDFVRRFVELSATLVELTERGSND